MERSALPLHTVDDNAEFVAMPECYGTLVGGASLKPDLVELIRPRRGAPAFYFICGKPRFTPRWAGSGQREVTTLPRV